MYLLLSKGQLRQLSERVEIIKRCVNNIHLQGEESLFKKDKHVMTHELGIQIRDLRLLDPLMTSTYPSAILFREKALVVNLEYAPVLVAYPFPLFQTFWKR